jgi:hypothetical protein
MNFSEAGWEDEFLVMCEEAWGRINGWEEAYRELRMETMETWERINAAEADRIRDAEIAKALDEIRQQVRDMESADIEAEEVRCLMLALALERTAPDWN